MKILTGIIAAILIAGIGYGQDIDQEQMARDIKIGEDIINSLLNQKSPVNRWHSAGVSGNYIPEYGVIFTIPSEVGPWPMTFSWDGESGRVVIKNRLEVDGDKVKILGDDEEVMSDLIENPKDHQEAKETYLESIMTTFLADYADLIGQLKLSDKIMIKSEQRHNNVLFLGSWDNYKYIYNYNYGSEDNDVDVDTDQDVDVSCCEGIKGWNFSAEVRKADLSDYRSGRIDRDQLLERITFQKNDVSKITEPELELLSSIFLRLYKSDLSNTYFATRAPGYNRIANFGVIYDWQVYSSNIDNGKHNMPTIDSYGLSAEERNKKVEQLYPIFIEQFKQQLVEYGRTLKGLEDHEILMFKIKLTQCKGCSIPQSVDLSVRRSVLADFEKQKIDLSTAASRVKLQEH